MREITVPLGPMPTARRTKVRERRATRRARVRLDTDARRAQLLELGMKIFAESTYDEVSIDDLAKAAGISKGLLYHYFPTKRDLYLAGLREIAGDLLAQTDVSQLTELPPIERIRRGIDAYLTFVSQRARPYVALMRGGIGSDPEVHAIVEGVREALVERLFTGPESPLATGDHRTPLARTALRGWIGFSEAAVLDWLTHGDLEQAQVRDLLVDMLLPTIKEAMGFSLSKAW
jgi:AcrR family transcriptional regulator